VRHLADARLPADRLDAMVNLDMIGRMDHDKVYVMGTESGADWPALLAQTNVAGLHLDTDLYLPMASDHASFQGAHVPAICFFTGLHKDYHRPSDTAEKINAAGAVRVLDLADTVLAGLIGRSEAMAYVPESIVREARVRARGAAASRAAAAVGLVPDFSQVAGRDGCTLIGVGPRSRAYAAGLRRGDRIVEWDGRAIPDVTALERALTTPAPGDVQVKVVRGEETLTFTLPQAEAGAAASQASDHAAAPASR
jgi:hypothetical protein